ncbi:MAG: hypothetical protein ACXWYS_04635 [Gaiellaceae bacterium]
MIPYRRTTVLAREFQATKWLRPSAESTENGSVKRRLPVTTS